MLPIEEQNQKRKELAKYSEADFKGMTVARLRELAIGVLPQINKLKKVELVKQLIEASQAERIVNIVVPEASPELLKSITVQTRELGEIIGDDWRHWTTNFYKTFRNTVQARVRPDGSWHEAIHGDIAGLAARLLRYLDTRKGETDGRLAMTTKLRYRTHICNNLAELVALEAGGMHHKALDSCLKELFRQVTLQISDLTEEKRGLQERVLATRKQSKETLDFKPVYEFAINMLNRLDEFKSSDWKRVSLALAIVTGRRMAEIHSTDSNFEIVDEHHVMFTGQLKVKGDAERYFGENPAYEIPVLVSADLVVKAHAWLKDWSLD